MSKYSELPIYNKLFYLLKDLYIRVPKFSKQYKYFLGEKILKNISDSIVLVYKINNTNKIEQRYIFSDMIETNMEELLVHIRIADELNQFPKKNTYFFLFNKIVEILDQARKWKKFFQKNNPGINKS